MPHYVVLAYHFILFPTGNGKKLLKIYINFTKLFKEKYLLCKEPFTLEFSIPTSGRAVPCLVAAPEPTSGVRLTGMGLTLCSLADYVTGSLWRPARVSTTRQVPRVQHWVPELLGCGHDAPG